MRKILVFISVLSLVSCDYFGAKKVSKQDVLHQKLQGFNWNEVDTYPSFAACKESLQKAEQQACFARIITAEIQYQLQAHLVVLSDSVEGKVQLYLRITREGVPKIDSVAISKTLANHLPNLRTWLEDAMSALPKIYPAQKQGIPVSTRFTLPIQVVSK